MSGLSTDAAETRRETRTLSQLMIHALLKAAGKSNRTPYAVILAGHNGSGKSSFWYSLVADELKVPLMNADRLMLSILPEPGTEGELRPWAKELRDKDTDWMAAAQQGVRGSIGAAMAKEVPFAFETVFSHWKELGDGRIESKADTIRHLQEAGYFVLLIFVGLSGPEVSIGRVASRFASGGHNVPELSLRSRFPRTQKAISHAMRIADAALLLDNSMHDSRAFSPVHARHKDRVMFDIRDLISSPPAEIKAWLNVVAPI